MNVESHSACFMNYVVAKHISGHWLHLHCQNLLL